MESKKVVRVEFRHMLGANTKTHEVSVHELLDNGRRLRNWVLNKPSTQHTRHVNNIPPVGEKLHFWYYILIDTLVRALKMCLEKEKHRATQTSFSAQATTSKLKHGSQKPLSSGLHTSSPTRSSNKKANLITKLFLASIMATLMLPMVLLFVRSSSTGVQITIHLLFVLAFSMALLTMTNAKWDEALAITAIYATVLVAFLLANLRTASG